MPNRSSFDLSHFCFQAGKIGRLQTLSVIPMLPGDSISININGNTRLAGLRRSLITDASMDLLLFMFPIGMFILVAVRITCGLNLFVKV